MRPPRLDASGHAPRPGRARKRFAQHFLEAAWVNKLVAAIGVTADDSIVEIGPGPGEVGTAVSFRWEAPAGVRGTP